MIAILKNIVYSIAVPRKQRDEFKKNNQERESVRKVSSELMTKLREKNKDGHQ